MGCIKFSDIITDIDIQRNAIMEEHVANLTTAQINIFMFHLKSNYVNRWLLWKLQLGMIFLQVKYI